MLPALLDDDLLGMLQNLRDVAPAIVVSLPAAVAHFSEAYFTSVVKLRRLLSLLPSAPNLYNRTQDAAGLRRNNAQSRPDEAIRPAPIWRATMVD